MKCSRTLFVYKTIFRDLGTVKHVLSGNSKIDKTKVLKANGSLMKVENIAHSEILLTCIKAIIGIENQFLVFFLSGSLRQVKTVHLYLEILIFDPLIRTLNHLEFHYIKGDGRI